MKKSFSKTRIILILSLLILLVINVYLRQRPYLELEKKLEEIKPKLRLNQANLMLELLHEELFELFDVSLNCSTKQEFDHELKQLKSKNKVMSLAPLKALDKYKVTDKDDRKKVCDYAPKMMHNFFEIRDHYIDGFTGSFDRSIVERYYYFDF